MRIAVTKKRISIRLEAGFIQIAATSRGIARRRASGKGATSRSRSKKEKYREVIRLSGEKQLTALAFLARLWYTGIN